MRIAIIGTHSTGKTTLLNELRKHIDLPFITEVARSFPRDITNNPNLEINRQMDIFKAQMTEESRYDFFISDRSSIDNAAYMIQALQQYGDYLSMEKYLDMIISIEEAIVHRSEYDYLFYIPIEFDCVDDGFRCTNEHERVRIDYLINKLKPETIEIIGTVEERVNKVLEVIL